VRTDAAFSYFCELANSGTQPLSVALDRIVFTGSAGETLDPDAPGWFDMSELAQNPLRFMRGSWHQGAFWLSGTVIRNGQEIPVRAPVFHRPVHVSAAPGRELRRPWIIHSAFPWQVSPGLIAGEDVERLEAEAGERAHVSGLVHDAELRALIQDTIAELSPGGSLELRAETAVWQDQSPRLAAGQALPSWRSLDPRGTAFAAVYDAAPGSASAMAAATDQPRTPVQLNAEQRAVVSSALTSDLTVASGPPGTGKTHLIVATALAQLAEGRTTLIATGSLAAADSIGEMLSRYPMVTALRFDGRREPALLGNELVDGLPDEDLDINILRASETASDLAEELAWIRSGLHRRLSELADGGPGPDASAAVDEPAPRRGVWSRLVGRFSASETVAPPAHSLQELWDEFDRLVDAQSVASGNLLEAKRRAAMSTGGTRRSLGQLARALRLAPVERRVALASHSQQFLSAAPLWFGTLDSVDTFLPTEAGLFDLVIFDEASQISQLQAAPALVRGRRAMVVGDPKQLRHAPMATSDRHAAAVTHLGLSSDDADQLDELTMSMFDAAATAAPVLRLREHFRSSPHIIGFSNQRFYDGQLQLMTQHPSREYRDAIHDRIVDLAHVDADGIATGEVRATVQLCRELVELGYRSLGVVAGFAAHAEALREALAKEFAPVEMERLELRCGTVGEFQGIERDVIVVSCGLHAANLHLLAPIEEPTAFNVMVTRAIRDVWIVSSLAPADLPDGLLRSYLEWSHAPPPPFPPQQAESGWRGEVARDLQASGDVRVVIGYPVGVHTVDLAIGTGVRAFGVETTLHPDGVAAHIERHLTLRRAGWELVDAFAGEWQLRREERVAWIAARSARVTGTR